MPPTSAEFVWAYLAAWRLSVLSSFYPYVNGPVFCADTAASNRSAHRLSAGTAALRCCLRDMPCSFSLICSEQRLLRCIYNPDGTFMMNGGEIRGSTAANNGSGVYVNGSTFNRKNGIIADEVYLWAASPGLFRVQVFALFLCVQI